MKRSVLVASLPHGPRDPVTALPPRVPGSVRRSTNIDQRRGDRFEVLAHGRDLRTAADGTTTVLDEVRLHLELAGDGTITGIESDPPEPALAELIGRNNQRGFRAAMDEAVPHHRDGGTVLHQLLDDVPMAALINGYGWTRELGDDFDLPTESADRLRDRCAGWVNDGVMLGAMDETGIFPIPLGPEAPDLDDDHDPLAWHDMEPMVPRSVRRRRRLDVVDGAPLTVDVHFRDSHLAADAAEDILHEYTLQAAVDPATLVVLGCEAQARTLPWPECPNALASAGRVTGEAVSDLRTKVHGDFRGTTTCTHLNDVLRSLTGVTALARGLASAQ
ncbi:MAG: DUF2889 domain-containing protein [Acidimicrobiales bacterium]